MPAQILSALPTSAVLPDAAPLGLKLAQLELSRFVRYQAEQTQRRLGFGWIARQNAPSTYQQLRDAYRQSAATGEPLPVSSLFCDDTVYARPEDNHAFRFWHDTHHVELGLSFGLEDEAELAVWHLRQAEAVGIAPGSLVYRLLEADTLGSLLVLALSQRFPHHQRRFVTDAARWGLAAGLVNELRQLPTLPPTE